MGKEQVAVNAINNHHIRWTHIEDSPLNSGYQLQMYEIDLGKGLLPKNGSRTKYYFPRRKRNGGVIIDVDTTDVAVGNLGPRDALTTHNLVECIGIALHMQKTDREYFGLKRKPIPGTDRFLLAHLPIPPYMNPPLRINELLTFAMREHAVLGVGVSAQPYIRPLVESALNSWHLKIKGFNPHVVVIDEKGTYDRGVVITQEGGAFLDPAGSDYKYNLHSDWKWSP